MPRFYRIVKANPPTREDFLSCLALGKVPPPGVELATICVLHRWEYFRQAFVP